MKEIQSFLEWDKILLFLKTNLFKLFIIYLFVKIGKVLKKRIERILKIVLEKSDVDKSLASFLISIYSVLYYFIIGYISIGILGINISSITTFLGATGIVLGIAFKETLGNFCGGIIILTFRPFRVGDTIEYNSYIGTVKRIELFYTKMINPQNELVIIPNGIVTNTEIRNIMQGGERRLDLKVAVSYESDVNKVKEILQKIIEEETSNDFFIEEEEEKETFLSKFPVSLNEIKKERIRFLSLPFLKGRKIKSLEKNKNINEKPEINCIDEKIAESVKNDEILNNFHKNYNKKIENNEVSKSVNTEKMILLSHEPVIGLGELGESSILFYVYVYTKTENYLKLKFKLNEKIKTEFDKEGIKIPYNQMEVHINNNN